LHRAKYVVDFVYQDRWGNPLLYTLASSLANCRETPGTFWNTTSDDTGQCFINTIDGRAADRYIITAGFSPDKNFLYTAGPELYIENLIFCGGSTGHFSSSSPVNVIAVNTEHYLAVNSEGGGVTFGRGIFFRNPGIGYFIGTKVGLCEDDGLSYGPGNVLELNVRSYSNGLTDETGNSNSTTGHAGSKIIRINGDYDDSRNRTVHDVQSGTHSWNLGCRAGAGNEGDQASWLVGGSDSQTAKMWLDSCLADGGALGRFSSHTGASQILHRLTDISAADELLTPSSIVSY
jgi:hypothetical protein